MIGHCVRDQAISSSERGLVQARSLSRPDFFRVYVRGARSRADPDLGLNTSNTHGRRSHSYTVSWCMSGCAQWNKCSLFALCVRDRMVGCTNRHAWQSVVFSRVWMLMARAGISRSLKFGSCPRSCKLFELKANVLCGGNLAFGTLGCSDWDAVRKTHSCFVIRFLLRKVCTLSHGTLMFGFRSSSDDIVMREVGACVSTNCVFGTFGRRGSDAVRHAQACFVLGLRVPGFGMRAVRAQGQSGSSCEFRA